jgi:hypothetical protein
MERQYAEIQQEKDIFARENSLAAKIEASEVRHSPLLLPSVSSLSLSVSPTLSPSFPRSLSFPLPDYFENKAKAVRVVTSQTNTTLN